ncbi:MAG TPA: alpha/beta fold hydrolase [Actinomycetota bacterium]|nr:alpha/beta fold hydrolase [Actinomycetota bacterium]
MELHRAPVAGGDIAYVDEGDGPAVLLLHGFPTSSHLWRDLIPILAPRFRVIAPDLVGYGASAKPADVGALTVTAQARHARELLASLRITEYAVVGHDLGGGVAQLLSLDDPVVALVLVDSIAFDAWPIEAVRMLREADPHSADAELVSNVVGVALDAGMADPGRLSDEDRAAYLRPWTESPPALLRAARGIDGEGLTGIEDRLAALDVRALLIWGEEDPFLPPELAERLSDLLPGSTVALLPGCGHFVTEDAPEAVLPLISEYLRVHYLREDHHHQAPTPVELGISFDRPPPAEPEI